MRAGVRAAGVLSEVVGVGLVLDGNVALIAESVSPTSPCDHSVLIPRPAFHLPAPFFPPPKDNSEVERSENAQKKQRRREQVTKPMKHLAVYWCTVTLCFKACCCKCEVLKLRAPGAHAEMARASGRNRHQDSGLSFTRTKGSRAVICVTRTLLNLPSLAAR